MIRNQKLIKLKVNENFSIRFGFFIANDPA